MKTDEKGITLWNKVLTGVMSLPKVRVDRTEFLISALKSRCDNATLINAIDKCPSLFLDSATIDSVADSCIKSQTLKVTTMSAAAGIPGGLAMFGTVPADIMQYYYHVLVLAQKLAYLYGYPSFTDAKGHLSDDAKNQLTIFVGVMSGVSFANEALNALARNVADQVVNRLPSLAITHALLYPIAEKVARWIGVSISKTSFTRGVSKVVPFVGGITSGGLTYFSFKSSAKRFKNKLKEGSEFIESAYK